MEFPWAQFSNGWSLWEDVVVLADNSESSSFKEGAFDAGAFELV